MTILKFKLHYTKSTCKKCANDKLGSFCDGFDRVNSLNIKSIFQINNEKETCNLKIFFKVKTKDIKKLQEKKKTNESTNR